MLAEEGEHPASAIHCLLGPVEWPVPIEDAVAGTVVAIELVHPAVLLELGLVLVHLLGARRAVVVAEYPEQRAAEVLRHVYRRYGCLGIELFLAHHDAAAPELGAGVDVRPRTGIDEGVPAAFFTTKPADEGTGLGLSLSHDIVVKQHAGSIEVDTRPGEFTEFKVILPRMAATSKAGADK